MYRGTLKKNVVLHNKESVGKMLWRRAPDFLRQYSEMTTFHGLKYLGERNRCLLERIFWGLALSAGCLGSAFFVFQVATDWRKSPVLMTVETQVVPSSNYPSPAVTVCTSTHVSNHKVDFATLISAANSSPQVFARVNAIHDLCGNGLVTTEYLDSKALKYVVQNYLPNAEDVILSIYRRQHEEKPMKIQMTITPVSLCFTHNMVPLDMVLREEFLDVYRYLGLFNDTTPSHSEECYPWTPDVGYRSKDQNVPLRLWGDGYSSSTKYLLGARDIDHDPTCSFGIKGISIYLHSPVEMPWRIHSNIYMTRDQRAMSFITPHIVSTESMLEVWSPQKRGCFFDKERYLRFFKVYTQRNCQRECDANATLLHCGCVAFSHPRNLSMKICGKRRTYCFMDGGKTTDDCQCLPACNEVDFEVESHARPWKFISNSSFTNIPPHVNPNSTLMTLIAIATKKKYLNITKRSALYSPAALVASIGGVLSLFLGISVMSVFELIYFLTLRILTNLWNARRQHVLHQAPQQRFWARPSDRIYPFVH